MESQFDLVVIGGGPAGLSGALAAGAFGKRVALIERLAVVGGAGINSGTIPSKALRESALAISGWKTRKLVGIDVSLRREAGIPELTRHHRMVSEGERSLMESRLQQRDVRVFHGAGRFVDAHTVEVQDAAGPPQRLRGEAILIATGSSPARPAGYAFEHPRVHDSDEILQIDKMPEKLAVIGAGVIGAEYASTFAELGVEVHLIDGRDALLPFLDREISGALAVEMARRGVHLHWKLKVASCNAPASGDIELTMESGEEFQVTDVLVAAGRSSNTADLGLAAAGLTAGERGTLAVNARFRTSAPHIYAAGDVIGSPALAATGMEQARVAVCDAFKLLPMDFTPILPAGIYTIPEVGTAGETEEEAIRRGADLVVGRAWYSDVPRGRLIGDESGFLKLVFRRDGLKLLGAHAIGEQATELVHIGLMALLTGGGAELLSSACFNYPTLGDLYKYASYDAMLQVAGR